MVLPGVHLPAVETEANLVIRCERYAGVLRCLKELLDILFDGVRVQTVTVSLVGEDGVCYLPVEDDRGLRMAEEAHHEGAQVSVTRPNDGLAGAEVLGPVGGLCVLHKLPPLTPDGDVLVLKRRRAYLAFLGRCLDARKAPARVVAFLEFASGLKALNLHRDRLFLLQLQRRAIHGSRSIRYARGGLCHASEAEGAHEECRCPHLELSFLWREFQASCLDMAARPRR